jgi:SecD/SecF fusion protein
VILAMLHDIAITIGIYSLVGKEVTVDTVAAVLTVLGYSIYDTIIIFDRIRENIPLMRRAPFATIANVSLWEPIRRSLATTFITLLPIGALLFFGGATLQDFAFALMVGILSGAYSSIFIAAPLLTISKEREPEYARRIGRSPSRRREGEARGDDEKALAAERRRISRPSRGRPSTSDAQAKRAPAATAKGQTWPSALSCGDRREARPGRRRRDRADRRAATPPKISARRMGHDRRARSSRRPSAGGTSPSG